MKKLVSILFVFLFLQTQAQEKMEVIRTEAVDRSSPVTNIFIDAESRIWVGNRKGLNQVFAPDRGELLNRPASEWSLLQTHDGNADIRLPLDELIGQMGSDGQAIRSSEDRITTAIFDEKAGDLWVGTRQSGLFQFKVEPSLKLVKQHHTGNSKLYSDQINTLFLDRSGQLWVGTGGGACFGRDGKWKLEERYFNITSFAENDTEIWVMGNDLLWRVNARQQWEPIDIPRQLVEGAVADIAFDREGKLWIASEIVSQFDPATDAYRVFGPAQEFTSQDVFCITVDGQNVVWIGTNDKGLYIIQKASTLYVSCRLEKPLRCNGPLNEASLDVVVEGGEGPYTYQWSNGTKDRKLANLGPGEYRVTVLDSRGKKGNSIATINDPNLKINMEVLQEAGPGASDGSARVNLDGPFSIKSYAWSTGEVGATARGLAKGNYTVTVTDVAGCTATGSVTIEGKLAELSAQLSLTKEINCNGSKDASLQVQVSGGKSPYQYRWNKSEISGQSAIGLAAGAYAVTVTDATGKSISANLTIAEPPALALVAKVEAPASTGNQDGKASVKVIGGQGNSSFKWDSGETTATAAKLGPGQHTVTVTDANGCTATASVDISENILALSASVSPQAEIKCAGGSTAGLKAEVSGGKGPFSFAWSSSPSANSDAAQNLAVGSYTVTVTDVTGSTATAKFDVKEPRAIDLTTKVDAPASTGNADGKATVKATGGTGDLKFKWDSGETTATAAKLGPGQHTVTVTDANGCTATASVDISENILALSASVSPQAEIKCAGGSTASLKAEVSGGKGPFRFAWSSSPSANSDAAQNLAVGSYTVTVTDVTGSTATAKFDVKEPRAVDLTAKVDAPASTGNADGKATAKAVGGTGDLKFKWDTGETTATAAKLGPGQHTVTVTDANGCTATASVDISENILALSASVSPQAEIKCAGGSTAGLKAEVSGGKGPFSFAWSSSPSANSDAAQNLAVGSYTVTVTDVTGSTATAKFDVKEPRAIDLTAKVDAPASTGNADGKATAKAAGGTGDFKYIWDSGETTATAAKLGPGQHTVTVTDANGCTATASVDISENILALSASISPQAEIKCAGGSTASLKAEVSGGREPYKLEWSNGKTGSMITDLAAGSYTLTVTDSDGKTAIQKIALSEPAPLAVTLTKNRPATTADAANGKATLTVTGGTGTPVFRWDNGETTAEVSNLTAGLHSITVTDANGCEEVVSIETKTRINPELASGTLRSGQVVRMDKIYFQPDSTRIDPESIPTLDELFEFMEDNPGIVIEVGGHTNGIPSHEFCDQLSSERAKSVAQYLVDKGLPASRLTYKGYGKRQPIASNNTPDGRARNQRVEIKIVRLE